MASRRNLNWLLASVGGAGQFPLAPGTFSTLNIDAVEPLALSTPIALPGGGVLALDGERTLPVSAEATLTVSIGRSGPRVVDVDTTLAIAARDRRFDLTPFTCGGNGASLRKAHHGD